MNLKNIFTLGIFIFFLFQNYLYSQDAIDIYRIEGSIDFDGQPLEPAWNNLNKFDMVMHRPMWL